PDPGARTALVVAGGVRRRGDHAALGAAVGCGTAPVQLADRADDRGGPDHRAGAGPGDRRPGADDRRPLGGPAGGPGGRRPAWPGRTWRAAAPGPSPR